MNKLAIGFGAAVLASGLFGVESQIVGYTAKPITKSVWHAVPVHFTGVDGATTMPLFNYLNCQGLVPGQYGDGTDPTMGGAPVIQVPSEDGKDSYTIYFYISDAYDPSTGSMTNTGWADSIWGTLVSDADVISTTQGFWFRAQCDDSSATGSGAVVDGDTATVELKSGCWQMFANPFPMAGSLATATTAGLTPGEYGDGTDPTMGGAPVIQVPSEDGKDSYTIYFYISDAYDPSTGSMTNTGWADSIWGTLVSGDQIPANSAVWFKSSTTGTLTFSK